MSIKNDLLDKINAVLSDTKQLLESMEDDSITVDVTDEKDDETASDSFIYKCPSCGEFIGSDEPLTGETIECPECGESIIVGDPVEDEIPEDDGEEPLDADENHPTEDPQTSNEPPEYSDDDVVAEYLLLVSESGTPDKLVKKVKVVQLALKE